LRQYDQTVNAPEALPSRLLVPIPGRNSMKDATNLPLRPTNAVMRSINKSTIALAASALLAAFAFGPAAKADPTFPRLQSHGGQFTRLVPADRAPDNPIIALDGSVIALSRFKGRVVVLNFWATWCAACRYELSALERLSGKYGQDDLAVIAISIDEEGFTAVVPYLRRHGITDLTVLLDPQQSLGSRFLGSEASGSLPLFGLPMTYFIDRDGNVLGYISGAVEWDSSEARRFVDFLLSSNRS